MIVQKIHDVKTYIRPECRLLGLDLGSKTIGVSISDLNHTIASPFTTIKRQKLNQDLNQLIKIIKTECVCLLIIGLPINMDGSEGRRSQSTRQFATNFMKTYELPIFFWDERLSTVAVEKFLITQVDMSRGRRSQIIDKLAAVYILQGMLDALNWTRN